MAQELIPVENAQVVRIDEDKQFKNPRLVFKIEDPLSEDNDTVQREVILWSTDFDTKELSDKSIAQTEKNLRLATGNDEITFDGFATGEGTHVSNWVAENEGAVLKEIYQNEKGYQIGLGGGSSEELGDSKHLKMWKEADGAYDPKTQRMMIKDALPEATQEAIDNGDTSHNDVFKTNNGQLRFSVSNHTVVDVVIMDANGFNDKHEDIPLVDIVDELVENYTNRKEVGKVSLEQLEQFKEGMETDPQKHGYRKFLTLVGGTSGALLPKASARMLKSILPEATRKTIAFNIMDNETGIVYRSSPLRAPQDTSRSWVPNYMEFVSPADITRHDVTDFLAKAELPNYQETAKNAIQDVLDGDIKNLLNPEFDKYDNVASNLLAFLRYFFQGRKVTVGSKIQEQEDMNLGSYITKFGAFSDLDVENYDTVYQQYISGEVVDSTPKSEPAPAEEVDPLAEDDEEAEAPEEVKADEPKKESAPASDEANPFAGHQANSAFDDKERNPFEM